MFSTVAIVAFASLAAAVPVKRGFGGKATYYATGLGACGEVNVDSDFIVALNSPQFGSGYPGPNCFKQVQINANGKSATATIMDQCPGCAYGDLDMSPSLFSHFADHSVGVFQMDWDFVGSGAAPAPATSEAPKTSSTPEPTPSSTYVAPSSTYVAPTTSEAPSSTSSTSSTWAAPSSSSTPIAAAKVESTSAEASSSSVWSAPASSSVVTSSVAPSSSSAVTTEAASTSATSTASAAVPTITVDLAEGNLAELCEAVAQMGKLVVVGASLANGTNGTDIALSNTTATVTFA